MPHRVVIVMRVQVRSNRFDRQLLKLAEEANEVLGRDARVIARDVELGAVTRGQHDSFGRRRASDERGDCALEPAAAEIEALTKFDRRGAVTRAYEK
jgi:hypothetical protein